MQEGEAEPQTLAHNNLRTGSRPAHKSTHASELCVTQGGGAGTWLRVRRACSKGLI